MATTPTDPTTLVGRWIRLDRDGCRPPHLGVLTRCEADPDHPGLWHWALRTPTGYMIGGPHLPADALTRDHRADVTRARRQIARRLRADRATLAGLRADGDPAEGMAHAVATLEDLQDSLHTQITTDERHPHEVLDLARRCRPSLRPVPGDRGREALSHPGKGRLPRSLLGSEAHPDAAALPLLPAGM